MKYRRRLDSEERVSTRCIAPKHNTELKISLDTVAYQHLLDPEAALPNGDFSKVKMRTRIQSPLA